MLRTKLSGFDGEPHSPGAGLKKGGGFRKIHPAIRLLAFHTEARDPVMTPQGGNTLFCSSIAAARLVSIAI